MRIIKAYPKGTLCQAETVEDYQLILSNIQYSWDYWKTQPKEKLDYAKKGQFYFPNKFVYKMGWIK